MYLAYLLFLCIIYVMLPVIMLKFAYCTYLKHFQNCNAHEL